MPVQTPLRQRTSPQPRTVPALARTVVGIDLGVRSVHIATPTYTTSIISKKQERSDELRYLRSELEALKGDSWIAYIEEPVVAGPRNLRTAIQMAQVSGVILEALNPSFVVPVTVWKKSVIGKGNAKKDEIRLWLKYCHPQLFEKCQRQDHVDAMCIRLYGESLVRST